MKKGNVETKREDGSKRVQYFCEGESLTRQEMTDDCDINKIVKRFKKTGTIGHLAKGQALYADVSDVGDYKSAHDLVLSANEKFMSLSAEVRNRFKNDPSELVDFVLDEKNREEAEALGLVQKKVVLDTPKPPSVGGGTTSAGVDGDVKK